MSFQTANEIIGRMEVSWQEVVHLSVYAENFSTLDGSNANSILNDLSSVIIISDDLWIISWPKLI